MQVKVETAPKIEGVLLEASAAVEYVHLLQRTGGCTTQPPPAVLRLLASKACRRAIMFGDMLTLEQCQEVLNALARCDLPFQCAHGRPTVAPLLQMAALIPDAAHEQDDCLSLPSLVSDCGALDVLSNRDNAHSTTLSLEALRMRGKRSSTKHNA